MSSSESRKWSSRAWVRLSKMWPASPADPFWAMAGSDSFWMWRHCMETRPANELLSLREFDQISELAFQTSGIDLRNGKQELVQARVGKKIRQGQFGSFKEYYRHVENDQTGKELSALLDALTTNFTSFLREATHFDLLRKAILPGIGGPIRIWSAACSTGEEPFTIAFSLLEELGMASSSRIKILASDLSTRVLEVAGRGTYLAERFSDCPQ